MVQGGYDMDLAKEPLAPQDGRNLGTQHLHGHLARVLQVLGEKYCCHSTGTEFANGLVPAANRPVEAFHLFLLEHAQRRLPHPMIARSSRR